MNPLFLEMARKTLKLSILIYQIDQTSAIKFQYLYEKKYTHDTSSERSRLIPLRDFGGETLSRIIIHAENHDCHHYQYLFVSVSTHFGTNLMLFTRKMIQKGAHMSLFSLKMCFTYSFSYDKENNN